MSSWTVLILLAWGTALSGCDLILVAVADATTPDPVQAVDVTWANSPNLCTQMIQREGRTAFLLQGNLDTPGYDLAAVPQPQGSNMVAPAGVRKGGVVYIYGESEPVDFEQTTSLPPMPGTESQDFTEAIKQASRISLYRETGDGTRWRECTFATRRMWSHLAM